MCVCVGGGGGGAGCKKTLTKLPPLYIYPFTFFFILLHVLGRRYLQCDLFFSFVLFGVSSANARKKAMPLTAYKPDIQTVFFKFV